MASNYTTNYQLNQWEAGDQVLRTEFNQDNQKIDGALAGLAAQNEELEVAVASKGNCHFYTTSYIGTGQVGANNPCTLSFPAKPIFFSCVKWMPLTGSRNFMEALTSMSVCQMARRFSARSLGAGMWFLGIMPATQQVK